MNRGMKIEKKVIGSVLFVLFVIFVFMVLKEDGSFENFKTQSSKKKTD